MTAMRKWILVIAVFALGWETGWSAKPEDLGNRERIDLNPAVARLSGHGENLEVDTTRLDGEWNWMLRTRPGVLRPDTSYLVSFEYRAAAPDAAAGRFFLLSRPYHAGDHSLDTMSGFLPNNGTKFRPVELQFRTGAQQDCAFQIHISKRLKGAVRNLRFTPAAEPLFIPAVADAAPASGTVRNLPSGAKEFEVERPKNARGMVVAAADFGFSPESADNTAALNRALAFCREKNAAKLELAPGSYRFTADASIMLDGMRDFELDGKGAKFIFLRTEKESFLINDCERLLLRNLSCDWDWAADPLASVVEVMRTDPGTVDFKFVEYDRFPRRDVRVSVLSSYDPVSRSIGIENGFDCLHPAPKTWLADNILRVQVGNSGKYVPGSLFVMRHYNYEMHCFSIRQSRHITFEDINLYSCAGIGFIADGVQYGQFRRVRVAPPENEPRRAITCTADILHVFRSKGSLKIEDCEFGRSGDDCINIHDNSAYITQMKPDRVEARGVYGGYYRVGDRIEFRYSDLSPTGKSAVIKQVGTADARNGIYEIVFDSPAVPQPLTPGDGLLIFNRAYDSRNIMIRNSSFHHNRARGILLLARDVTVENNLFRHHEMEAIKIETGYGPAWCEGYGASNIVVRGNRFEQVHKRHMCDTENDGMPRAVTIGVYMDSILKTECRILSDILFEDNLFIDSFGLIASISSARNVIFRNNTFADQTERKIPFPRRSGFFVENADSVSIVDNCYIASPLVPFPGVWSDGRSVTRLVAEGNRSVSGDKF